MLIEEFNLNIRYLPGRDNTVADGLSRLESETKTITYIESDKFPLVLKTLGKKQQ